MSCIRAVIALQWFINRTVKTTNNNCLNSANMTAVQILALAVAFVSITNICVLNRLIKVQKMLDEVRNRMLSRKERNENMKPMRVLGRTGYGNTYSAKHVSISTVYDRLPRFTIKEEEESISSTPIRG